ncbi:MAG: lactonase family protein [Planctomycetes bacterium]|nr:lactonase family protein [Planctomycetota bacterium]
MLSLVALGVIAPILASQAAAPADAGARPGRSWHVFFGTEGSRARGIHRASFDGESGRLSAAELVAEAGSPGFLALHPALPVLYAVADLTGGPSVAAYRVGPGGALEALGASPIGDGGGVHVAVHPSGRFLLTAQYGRGSVALFPLDAEGRPGAAQLARHAGGSRVVAQRQDAPHPHGCFFAPDGRFALVPDLGLDGVVIYRIDAQAPSIERHGFATSVAGGGPRHLRFTPDGRFIHLLNELALSVTSYAWDAESGSARRLATVATLTEAEKAGESFNSAAEIVVHPSGRFVYTSNRGHDSISVFAADPASGALERIQVQPIRGAFPRHIALSPDGAWLLAAGAHSDTVSVHRVDPATGRLTYTTRGVVGVPAPICVLFAAAR